MIILYSGIPGSGKSYKMVHDLLDLKDEYYVVHNIDGMKKDTFGEFGINWVEYCEREGMEVTDFFSKEYQLEFTEAVEAKYDRNCIVVIDEAHEWFDKNKKTIKMWLSYHRHLNQEIWLVAHKSTNLPAVYRSFVEIEYRAKSSSLISIPGFFLYNRISGGERVGYKFVRIDKKVFQYYKSQNKGFKKPQKSLFIPMCLLFCIAGVSYFLIMPHYMFKHGKKDEKKIAESSGTETISEVQKVRNGYRFAGKVGNKYLVEDLETGRVLAVDEIPKFLVMGANGSELNVYDVENKKTVLIHSYVEQAKRPPATPEPVESGASR